MGSIVRRRPSLELTAVAAIAVGSAVFIWFITGPRGLGLTPDSIAYVSMARSLGRGDGLQRWGEDSVTTWPALYPALLWAIAAIGRVDVLDAGRIVACAASALLTGATWALLRRTVAGRGLRLATLVAVVFGGATITVANKLLTDQLFATGAVLFLVLLVAAARTGLLRWVLAVATMTALLFTTRYVGALLVPVAVVVLALLPLGRPWSARLRSAAVVGAAGVVVPVLYVLRNRAVSGTAFRQSSAAQGAASSSFSALPEAFSGWFVGYGRSGALFGVVGVFGAAVVIGAAVALVVIGVRASRARSGEQALAGPAATPAAGSPDAADHVIVADRTVLGAATLLLGAATVGLRAVVAFDLDSRTILVLVAPAMVVLAAALEACTPAPGTPRVPWWRSRRVVAGAFVVWALALGLLGVRAGLLGRPVGSGYAAVTWDPTIAEVRAADLETRLPDGCDRRSNEPDVLLLGGTERFRWARDPSAGTLGAPVCLVWMTQDATPDDRAHLDELRSRFGLVEVAAGETYTLYLDRR